MAARGLTLLVDIKIGNEFSKNMGFLGDMLATEQQELKQAVEFAKEPAEYMPEKQCTRDRRCGYDATLPEDVDAIDGAAIATVAAHWNAWQSIVEQVSTTLDLSLDRPEVAYKFGKHTTIAAGPLLQITAASADVRLTPGPAPSVVPSVAKSSIAPMGKEASKATAVANWSEPSWEGWGSDCWTWNSWSGHWGQWQNDQWNTTDWGSSSWNVGDRYDISWRVRRPIVSADPARPASARHCLWCREVQEWDYALEHHHGVDRTGRHAFMALAQRENGGHEEAISIVRKLGQKIYEGELARSASAFVTKSCLRAMHRV